METYNDVEVETSLWILFSSKWGVCTCVCQCVLTFHSVGKCYWGHHWHAATPQSQPHWKHRRWAPLSSAAWLYKSCSAPKHTHARSTYTFKHTCVCIGFSLHFLYRVHSHILQKEHTDRQKHTPTHTYLPEVTHSLKHPPVLGPSQSTSLTSP